MSAGSPVWDGDPWDADEVTGIHRAIESLRRPFSPRAGSTVQRVLVVDDEPAVARFLGRECERQGVKADTESDPVAALSRLAGVDAVLVDLAMPGLDGVSWVRRALTIEPDLVGRIAFVTGRVGGRQLDDLLDTGAVVLGKPPEPDEIRAWFGRLAP